MYLSPSDLSALGSINSSLYQSAGIATIVADAHSVSVAQALTLHNMEFGFAKPTTLTDASISYATYQTIVRDNLVSTDPVTKYSIPGLNVTLAAGTKISDASLSASVLKGLLASTTLDLTSV